MNTNQSSKKNILIIVGIVVIALMALFYFMGGSTPAENGSLLGSNQTSDTERVGTRVLSLLNQIESLRIDTSLFGSAAYQTLVDYSVVIPPQNVGRPNPFAPLPGVRTGAPAR